MPTRLTIMLTTIALAASAALAQDKQPEAQLAPDAKAPAAEPSKAEWPKSVDKKLYADDFRGKPAPEFVVETLLGGEKVPGGENTSGDYRPDRKGKVVLIDFWATWCPPCRELIPELNEFHDKFSDDLVVIGVSGEKPETVKQFMREHKFRYYSAIDTQERMSKALKVQGIPHVLIISTDGVVRWQGFPLSDEEPLSADIVKQIIDADPGVKERRAKEAEEAAKKENAAKDKKKPADDKAEPEAPAADPR